MATITIAANKAIIPITTKISMRVKPSCSRILFLGFDFCFHVCELLSGKYRNLNTVLRGFTLQNSASFTSDKYQINYCNSYLLFRAGFYFVDPSITRLI